MLKIFFFRDPHGFHKSDEPDERKAHDGTLEYTSRDAHTGAHSRLDGILCCDWSGGDNTAFRLVDNMDNTDL